MRRGIGFAICFSILSLFVINVSASAAEVERSYEQLSPNGKYVFVMLAKGPGEAGIVDTLKDRYSHSGLYKVGDPEKPLWSVNWYSSHVHVSSDGMHLVKIGRLHVAPINGKPNMEQLAIAFYTNGKITKKYIIEDLFGDPGMLVKVGIGFQWQKRIAFDDSSERLEVTLITGQKNIFDIKSGSIIGTKVSFAKRR